MNKTGVAEFALTWRSRVVSETAGRAVARMATRATVKAAAEALLPTRAQCGLLLLEGDLAPALLKALHTPQQHAALSVVSRTCA